MEEPLWPADENLPVRPSVWGTGAKAMGVEGACEGDATQSHPSCGGICCVFPSWPQGFRRDGGARRCSGGMARSRVRLALVGRCGGRGAMLPGAVRCSGGLVEHRLAPSCGDPQRRAWLKAARVDTSCPRLPGDPGVSLRRARLRRLVTRPSHARGENAAHGGWGHGVRVLLRPPVQFLRGG